MRDIPGVTLPRPVEVNAVFAILPKDVTERLHKRFSFYTWNEATGEARWMCAFNPTEEDAVAEEMRGRL